MDTLNVFLKFDPAKIYSISQNLDFQHKRMLEIISSIQKKADSLAGSWQGEAAALYFQKIRELHSSGEEMAKILFSFGQDLANASGIYKDGETGAKHKAEALPTEGVFLV